MPRLSGLVLLALGGFACSAPETPAPPPDVLFIAVDDLNDWVGVLGGHPQTLTPNIDRLAARGMTFVNAHAPAPLCNASRTAVLSGLRPSTSGVYANAPDWRTLDVFDGRPTLPRYLRDHGYESLGAGKIFHAHTFGASGFSGFNDREAWDRFYPSVDRQLPDEVGPFTRPANGNPITPNFDWSVVVAEDSATADGQVVSWVERALLADPDAPRFVAAGIYRPHLPWFVPEAYFDRHPLDDILLPDVDPDDLDDVPEAGRIGTHDGREWHDWILESGRWKEGVQGYLASVSFADAMVGRLVDALDRSGRAESTIIVLWADHGFHLGEKERWRKMTLWEESTRVPLVVVAPGVTSPGTRSDQPVSLMDLYPTLAELAGLDVPDHLEGESLVPMLRDPGVVRERPALTTYGYRNHALRSLRYRYIRYEDGTEELYDHESDPDEWTNLAGDPAYAETIRSLARWLPAEDAPDARDAGE